jgi:two-component system LytT family response regulator
VNSEIKAMIVEDELPARELIKTYLKDISDVEIIAECENGFDALKAINELKPDLIFLDIQIPKLTGFELLEVLDHTPDIIFTTAFNEYAIKAFELNAIDYLLKPFSKERFKDAVDKAKDKNRIQQSDTKKINNLKDHITENPERLDRIVIKSKSKIEVISVETIKYIEAQDDYVMFYSEKGRFIKQGTMNFYELHLNPKAFVRIHRSYIVNIEYIDKLELFKKDHYIVILKDGSKLNVSKQGYKKLKTNLNF